MSINQLFDQLARPEQAASVELTQRERLLAIADNWLRIARRKFVDAETEAGDGKRLVEHGAMCYFNCAEELKAVLDVCESQVSQFRPEHRA